MKCPQCGKRNKDVVRTVEAGPIEVIRHRRCKGCGTWRTRELLIPRSFQREVDIPSAAHRQATGSAPVGQPASSQLIVSGSSSLALIADPDQTHARKSKANADVFPVVGDPKQTTWSITDDEFETLQQAYPTLDIAQQIKQALAWVKLNPANRKTAGGMGRFLNGWMARNQNRGVSAPKQAAESFAERDARIKREAEARKSAERAEAMRVQRELNEQLRKAGA